MGKDKNRKYDDPAASLDEIMREDAELADKAHNMAYDARIMGGIAIGLSILSLYYLPCGYYV